MLIYIRRTWKSKRTGFGKQRLWEVNANIPSKTLKGDTRQELTFILVLNRYSFVFFSSSKVNFFFCRDFRVSHALSHHLYPNTLMDLEISAFEPLVYWNPRKDKPFISKHFALLVECLYFPFAFSVLFITRWVSFDFLILSSLFVSPENLSNCQFCTSG